jgi:hypothetical protein
MFLIALFLVLPAIWLLLTNWQLTLIGLGVWLLVRIAASITESGAQAEHWGPLAPAYLRRWTWRRRLEAGREHAQWQERFDAR